MNNMYYITMESFGSDLPVNWEEIADYLNAIIDTYEPGDEIEEKVNNLWESYWNGELEDAPEAITEIEIPEINQTVTWSDFDALPFADRNGAKEFWEDGYDYSDPDFWAGREASGLTPGFIKAVLIYDALMHKGQ